MRLIAWQDDDKEQIGVIIGDEVVSTTTLNRYGNQDFPTDFLSLLGSGRFDEFKQFASALGSSEAANGSVSEERKALLAQCLQDAVQLTDIQIAPLLRRPRKIWGIGLNYVEHAGDLKAVLPTEEPASFMKADTTLIGPGDTILLPWQSARVTAEAEIAVVIGKTCHNVSIEDAADYVAGFVSVIDMTAEDILQKNPRFLTRAKNFDTFFSFGGELLTVDELQNLSNVVVGTYKNGQLHRENVIGNMTFDPWYLVSFHSQVMTLLPGDIISTGTPGAVVIRDGDVAECRIEGFLPLVNPVSSVSNQG